jgi:serine/threonine protein kinase
MTAKYAALNTSTDSAQARSVSIGNYSIGKAIGEGTFGKVKIGVHNLTGENVAIKILEKSRI